MNLVEPIPIDIDWSDPSQALLVVLMLLIAALFQRIDELEASFSAESSPDWFGLAFIVLAGAIFILSWRAVHDWYFRRLDQKVKDDMAEFDEDWSEHEKERIEQSLKDAREGRLVPLETLEDEGVASHED